MEKSNGVSTWAQRVIILESRFIWMYLYDHVHFLFIVVNKYYHCYEDALVCVHGPVKPSICVLEHSDKRQH